MDLVHQPVAVEIGLEPPVDIHVDVDFRGLGCLLSGRLSFRNQPVGIEIHTNVDLNIFEALQLRFELLPKTTSVRQDTDVGVTDGDGHLLLPL